MQTHRTANPHGRACAAIRLMTLIVMMPTNATLIGGDALSAEETER